MRHALGSWVCDALQLLALCRPMTDVCWQLLATRLSKAVSSGENTTEIQKKSSSTHSSLVRYVSQLYNASASSHHLDTLLPLPGNCVDLLPFPRCAMLSSSLQGRMHLIRANASHWQRLGSRLLSCAACSTDVAVTDASTRAWIQQLPTASEQAFTLFCCDCQPYVKNLFRFFC